MAVANWHEALKVAVKRFDTEEVKWGVFDCCQFVNLYAYNLTGKDYAAEFDYSTKGGASKILVERGGMQGLLEGLLGKPSGNPQAGDIVLIRTPEGVEAPGVYTGYCVYVVEPSMGLVRIDGATVIQEAWCLQGA